ncbi:hypothetical protein V2J09_020358 [Rumex salicifolius]
MANSLIFVYGTLKRSFPNHYLIEDLISSNDAVSLPSTFRTVLPFPLVLGPLSIPFLLNLPGSGHRVRGELYSVSARGLARLDELEGVASGHYERLPVQVESSSSRDAAAAEAYFGHRSFAEEMWRKCGEAAVEEYEETDAGRYVKTGDRSDGFNLLEKIHHYLASVD